MLHVPAGQGITTWVNGDIYTVKITADGSDGTLGFLEATVPPGGALPPHVHRDHDEAFYLLSGELEIVDEGKSFTAGSGDFIFCPRGRVHGLRNSGLDVFRMLFLYAPGGVERLFMEGGDVPQPGMMPRPWGPECIDKHALELMN